MEKDKCTHVNYNWNGLLKEGICVDCMAKLLSPPIQPSEQQPQGAEPDEHTEAAKILVPYILGAPRSVGKGANFEEYILCRDFEEIIEKIKSHATQQATKAKKEAHQWISVKEQTPEVNQWVLGFIVERSHKSGDIISEDISVVSRNDEGDWFENAGDVIDYAEVTHWSTLPEAPKN